jgi:hypothetical protein
MSGQAKRKKHIVKENATNGMEWIEIWHSDKKLQSNLRHGGHTVLL